jgi:hypothetical protein
VLPGPTANYEVGSATFIGRGTYFVDLGPIFFMYFCARDTSKARKNPFGVDVNRIDRGFLYHPAAARSDVKAKKNPLSLLYREPPLLGEDSDIWHKPRREPGDVAEARLLAFPRGSIWYAACHYRSSCQTFGGEIEESCLLVCHFYLPKERADTYRYKNPIGQVSFS